MVNALLQVGHTKGRSPVCVREWICSADVLLKGFSHVLQKYREPVGLTLLASGVFSSLLGWLLGVEAL